MPLATAPRRLVHDLVLARLRTLVGVSVYDGEVSSAPPVIPDNSGRVKPYVVLYAGVGRRSGEVDLCDSTSDAEPTFQTSCVAGYQPDLLNLVERVVALLEPWAPNVADAVCSQPRIVNEPGTARRDDDAGQVPRWYVPLIWRLTVSV